MPAKQEHKIITASELASLFGLSAVYISRLTDDGILIPVKSKRPRQYPLDDSIKRYTKHLRDKLANRSDSKEALNEALRYKTELQARKMEVELDLLEGRAHYVEDVRLVMNDMLGSFRARLWAFPNTISDRLVSIPDREQVGDILREEIANLCVLLADYSPGQFYERNPDCLEEDESDEATEANGRQATP